MNIGWLCYGFVHRDFIAADGAANIRIPIIEKLINANHRVYFLGHHRQQKHSSIVFSGCALQFEYHYKSCQNIKDAMLTFELRNMPEIDVLFVEVNAMGTKSVYHACVINYYLAKNVKIKIWDEDNLYGNYKSKLKILDIDINDIEVLTPYSKIRNKKQTLAYYPYNGDLELEPIKGIGITYIGNDYRRRDALKRFYNNDVSHIYGKFKDVTWNSSISCKFEGSCKPRDVHSILSRYATSIQVVRKDYANLGLMTQRMNEVLESGTILLIDSAIKDCDKFVERDYIVSNGDQAVEIYKRILKLSSEEYADTVHRQRDFYKKANTTYDDLLKIILN